MQRLSVTEILSLLPNSTTQQVPSKSGLTFRVLCQSRRSHGQTADNVLAGLLQVTRGVVGALAQDHAGIDNLGRTRRSPVCTCYIPAGQSTPMIVLAHRG